jgi:enoyl-CoA hydratase
MTDSVEWTPMTGLIEVALDRGVAVVTLSRPQKLNALNFDMRRELAQIVRCFGREDVAVGIVVTGSGRAFCAGEDLAEAAAAPTGMIWRAVELFNDLTRAALSTSVPVVAALNGIAVGGAAEWTLCFDARIGTSTSEYFFPENRIGLPMSNASSYLLPRLVGARAVDVALSGRRICAQEARRIGLIDELVDADVVEAAIAKVLSWTDDAKLTAVHLGLLRPPLEAIEAAFALELAISADNVPDGMAIAGGGFVARSR